jgi:predicted nucleic acid-binding protein
VKTAVDSSVLLDVLTADAEFGERSRSALKEAYDRGGLVACEVVWAETFACSEDTAAIAEALELLGVRFEPLGRDAAELAARMWRTHRKSTAANRQRVIADFLIGAHAQVQADALLSRDRGFYRGVFRELRLLDPSGAQ